MRGKLLDDFKTDKELAAELKVHPRTVQRALARGELVGARFGKLNLIDIPASRAALQKRARKNANERRRGKK